LAALGRERNPERPYEDDRVDVVIDDGRAFLERATTRYDLILFALPDSLTLVSGQSSLRLESYLFTREAFAAVREHLEPDGTFAVYNYFREPWLVDRFGTLIEEVFGRRPCLDEAEEQGGFALLTVGRSDGSVDCGNVWAPRTDTTSSSTDDRPFPYLRSPGVPTYYATALALILLGSVVAIRTVSGPFRGMLPYLDLFFMGAAFLLLETMNVVRFALLFGTTWFVNALVFAGILVTVLAAVELARRMRPRHPARLYVLLFLTLGVAWVVPLDALLALRPPLRFVAATALAFAPIFVANLIFAERFRRTAASAVAFGVNIIGAMLGGVLEYLSLAVGHRSLLIVAGGLYALAFATGRRGLAPDHSADDHVVSPVGSS
ncbi:MAG TPA: spermidine synthase, partial [Actinomycetota bacterium]|nr:spermidine synthase [Actinomycetota bacterium]